MDKENINNIELIKLIYNEVKNTNCILEQNNKILSDLDKHTSQLEYLSKKINDLDNKIEKEKDERVMEIAKIEGINDYDKIILKNLEGRICILEEETEKYIVN